ncbi:MAG: hypothetical protein ABIY50_09170 [Ignavibacteria bacterium]
MKFINFITILILLASGCNFKPEPEPLPLSVRSTLNLLQESPQFVMYLNFKNMRRTEFWKKNVSDSLFNAEKTFGSLLNTFKMATGASISDGLDELYYSNSWFGENAIVMKGVFDRNKLTEYLTTDSLFSIAKYAGEIPVYIKNDIGLYFFFKDDFTLCASNYLKQLDVMSNTRDTSQTGVLANARIYDAVSKIIFKEDLWMVSTEKIFIRGIFQNFVETTSGIKIENYDSLGNNDTLNKIEPGVLNDSTADKEKLSMVNLYKKFNAISFSAKMSNELKFLVQCECVNEEAAKYFRSILNGVITVSKISSARNKAGSGKIFEKLKLDRYDNSVFIELNIDESNLQELKKTNLMSEPE